MNYGIGILLSKYHSLRGCLRDAHEGMLICPNEHDHNTINGITPILAEIKECLDKLGVDIDE